MLMKVLSANAATSTSAEKISGQTNKQTNKQTREPLSKGDSRTGLVAFHIQLPQILIDPVFLIFCCFFKEFL